MSLLKLKTKILLPIIKSNTLNEAFLNHGIDNNDYSKLHEKVFGSSTKKTTISMRKLGKVYDNGFKAIHNFNLDVEEGEFVTFLGPSGCGKTTILRMIAGLEYISEGQLRMGDLLLNSALPKERKLAMVFQNYALYPYMDVYNNIAFGLKIATWNNDKSSEIERAWIDAKDSTYIERKALKVNNWDIKHSKNDEIIEAKANYLKARSSNKTSKNDLQKLKDIWLGLKSEEKKYTISNIETLKQNNITIRELRKQSIADRKTKNDKAKEKLKELSQKFIDDQVQDKINELKNESKETIIKLEKEYKEAKGQEKEFIKKLSKSVQEATKYAKADLTITKHEKVRKIFAAKGKGIKEREKILEKAKDIKKSIEKEKNITGIKVNKLKRKYKFFTEEKLLEIKYRESVAVWRASIRDRITSLAKMVGIDKYLKRKPAALSGGQRQRVALVRAISKDAKLFLYDEPLSNLDAKLRGAMRTEIRSLHEKIGSISIFVTHDQVEAMTMSDKIVLMNRGYIQQVGTPAELFSQPSNVFAADFIGSPRINLLNGKLESVNKLALSGGAIDISSKVDDGRLLENKGKKVIVGIRPQSVIFSRSELAKAKAANKNVFTGQVTSVENIGHEKQIMISSKQFGDGFVGIAPSYIEASTGEEIEFALDADTVHIFNSTTGISLTSKINEATAAALKVWAESADERIKNMVLSDKEIGKERVSRIIAKEAYGLIDRKYGYARKEKRAAQKAKVYKDVSVSDVNNQIGN